MKRNVINETSISFPARSVNESYARYAVSSFCAQLDPTLEEISERCGFSSISYFCRIFKETTGMTPGEFRRAFVG